MPDFSSFSGWALATILLFLILALRYFLIGSLLHWIFYIRKHPKWQKRKIFQKDSTRNQLRRELKWSMISTLIFALSGSLLFFLWQEGLTMIYLDVDGIGWLYLPLSLAILLALNETYYYWLHRWMHQPGVYRIVHKVHHESHITSPWTAFSFHPLEALLQAVFLPVVVMLLPVHPIVLIILLMIMTFSGFVNHLGYEIYPENFKKHFLGKWLIGATHHARHHRQFQNNYGLYFNFWDKWKKTEFPASLRVVRNNNRVPAEKDNRAKLFIVKPHAIR